jgi:hypothetical protein
MMEQTCNMAVGGLGGFLLAAILFELVLPGIAQSLDAWRRARGTGEVERGIVTVRYVCHEHACFGDVQAVNAPPLSTTGWHEHRCTRCGSQYALRVRYPFTRPVKP